MSGPQASPALSALVSAAADAAATRSRTAKIAALAAVLAQVPPAQAPVVVGLLLGSPVQGRLGVGWRTVASERPAPAAAASLSVADVDEAFTVLATARGAGSAARRTAALTDLLGRATATEQDFLVRVLTGEMRTGALAGVLTDAIGQAAAVPVAVVRRAAMLSGDLGATARAALAGEDLARITLTPGVPVQPMLAASAPSVEEAVAALGPVSVEYKLDGARLQVHRVDGVVRAYTRSLAEVTDRVPEVVELVGGFPGGDLVLDGETLTLDADGRARPFQDTMSRFGGRDTGDRPLSVSFFDVLYAQDRSLVDAPLSDRHELLQAIVGPALIPGALIPGGGAVDGPAERARAARDTFDAALAAGHEGVVVKALGAPYAAGRRGADWIKVKPVYTFDLVVLAVERGSGRRTGRLSNLHLGARDPDGRFGDAGGFVMVGKTFKGLTDDLLRWQTEFFPTIATGDDGYVLTLAPETVVEVAIDGVQRSSRYPGGLALRFARVKRYRTGADAKPAAHADTVDDLLQRLPPQG
ncbi:ATP-dependent DNA ligase [Gordonia alkaliphila]|uniref:ATP-dependent DNA ligase n=1 Tax=Gordonia alkaliphila TaxID=1053547 RepID=UPI001FF3E16D|nr:ATP-dependent DNA ligase [Gordonia alkaliphila]MCK0440791.1 ATP-dependent DNA ligase [Gordonia alkaliphila]